MTTSRGFRPLGLAVSLLTLVSASASAQTSQRAASAPADPQAVAAAVLMPPVEGLRSLTALLKASYGDAAVHEAMAYLQAKASRWKDAAGTLDRASRLANASGGPDIFFNRQLCDVRLRSGARGAMVKITQYLQGEPEMLNERFVDLLGASLNLSLSDPFTIKGSAEDAAGALLQARIERLEELYAAAHPEKPLKKWGALWLPRDKWAEKKNEVDRTERELDRLRRELGQAKEERMVWDGRLNQAHTDDQKEWYRHGSQFKDDRDWAKDGQKKAMAKEIALQDKIKAIQAKFPRPDFTLNLAPLYGPVPKNPDFAATGSSASIDPLTGTPVPAAKTPSKSLTRGMSEAEVEEILGAEPQSTSMEENGETSKVYVTPRATVYVRFRDGKLVSFREQRQRNGN